MEDDASTVANHINACLHAAIFQLSFKSAPIHFKIAFSPLSADFNDMPAEVPGYRVGITMLCN